MVITSRYHVLMLSIANKVPILFVMTDGIGDKVYYYNKNGGFIQQVFNSFGIDETRLMQRNFIVPSELVKENFTDLVFEQKDYYTSQVFQENMIVLNKLRIDYIKDYMTTNKFVPFIF